MSGKRQNHQLKLDFGDEARGETSSVVQEGTETLVANRATESPAKTDRLMEVHGEVTAGTALPADVNSIIPTPLQRARHQTLGRVDLLIAPFGERGFILRAFEPHLPLGQ